MQVHCAYFTPRKSSGTRYLLDNFLSQIHGSISQRDLAADPLPMMDAQTVRAYLERNYHASSIAAEGQAHHLGCWDEALAEASRAEILVVAAPIYNFHLPTPVQAWFDALMQRGAGWEKVDDTYVGCLGPRHFVWLTSAGMDLGPEGASTYDLARPWFRQVAEFLGSESTHIITADCQGRPQLGAKRLTSAARESIALAQRLNRLLHLSTYGVRN